MVLTLTSVRWRSRKRSKNSWSKLHSDTCISLSLPWLTEWKAVRVEWRHFLCEPFVPRDWLTKARLISLSFALSCLGNPEVTTPRLGNRSAILTWCRNALHKIISHITSHPSKHKLNGLHYYFPLQSARLAWNKSPTGIFHVKSSRFWQHNIQCDWRKWKPWTFILSRSCSVELEGKTYVLSIYRENTHAWVSLYLVLHRAIT